MLQVAHRRNRRAGFIVVLAACLALPASPLLASSADGQGVAPPGIGPLSHPPIRALTNVAIFQDQAPWGSTANESYLTANGIPYTIYDSADIGVVDLAPFDKVVISSQQPLAFYNVLSTNRAWFESYVTNGGRLEFHGATYFPSDDWSALPMPGGITIAPQTDTSADDFLTIVEVGHPLVTTPNPIDDAMIDNWGWSTHSYFTAPTSLEIIQEDEFTNPVLLEFSFGNGCIIATMMTLEFAAPPLLENILLRECPVVPVELESFVIE